MREPVPALCLHGLGVSPRHLRPLVTVLAKDRPVDAPELPLGVPVETLAALADDRLRQRSVVFANSMGCQVAVELALRARERVAALVLVGPTADPAAPTLRQQFARLAHDSLHEPAALNWVVASDYLRRGARQTLRSAREMLRHRIDARAELVDAPGVVVRGERDPIVPQPWAEEVARQLRCDVAVVPGAAHAAHFTHPEAVVAAARPLLLD